MTITTLSAAALELDSLFSCCSQETLEMGGRQCCPAISPPTLPTSDPTHKHVEITLSPRSVQEELFLALCGPGLGRKRILQLSELKLLGY